MKLTAQQWSFALVVGTLVMVTTGGILPHRLLPIVRPLAAVAQPELDHPFAGQGIFYVQACEQWREAFIEGIEGQPMGGQRRWRYTVRYLDATGGTEADVPPERMATVAVAQAQGLTENVYDLSTQAGIDQMLAAHNTVRQSVGALDLIWSPELAAFAQEWADILVAEQAFRHRPMAERDGGAIGESLSMTRSTVGGGALRHPHRAISGWVAERNYYDTPPIAVPQGKCAATIPNWCGPTPKR
jgi:pathogenesis-related protein 1